MKKLFTLLSIGFLALQLCAQVPQGIQFQLIIRDGNGNILPEQELVLQLSVIQEIPEGNIVYQETHDVVTNAFGLVNIVIGQGNSSIGNFSELDWGIGPYFLQTAIDLEGIGAFQIMGAAQFLSVPYALYAGQVNDTSTWSKQEDAVYYDKGQVAVGTNQPDSSAALDVTSDVQGFLPPRMTTEERDAIPNPAAGLIIYNTNIHCINFYNGVEWIEWGRDPMDTFECGQVFTDTRDKKQYRTVQIGEQCWFAENLNYGTKVNATTSQTDNGQVEKYCYENSPANCLEYGGLYQWDEMMAYDTVEFTQGICPEGWHLPNQAEWQMLIDAYGGASLAGNELVSAGTSGFDALMNGKYESGTGFSGKDNLSTFWSSTGIPGTTGTGLDIESGNPAVNTTNTSVLNAFGVRCVQGLPNRIDPSVRVIDTTVYHLISDSLELSQGIYRYEIIGSRKSKDLIVADNIVIGTENDGYLRKVEEAVINGNEMTLTTISATMEDTFIEGEFDFSTDLTGKGGSGFSFTRITYVAPGVEISPGEDGGIQFNFNNYILYEAPNISVKITVGHVSLNPNFKFDFKFKYSQVKRLAFYADQTSFNDSLDVQLTVTGSVNNSIEKTFATYKKYMLKMVGYVPVVIVITTELKGKAVLNFDAAFSATTGYTNTNTLSFGMKYEYGNWQKIWNLQSNTTMDPLTWNGKIAFLQELQIIPEIDIKFYGVAGPYFNLPLWEKLKANYVLPAMNFDASLDVGLNGNLGANITIFGNALASYNKQVFGFSKNLYTSPYKLEMVSGNEQSEWPNNVLPAPLKVKVTDSENLSYIPAMVHFSVETGGGSLSTTDVWTDGAGLAETTWTLGEEGAQTVKVEVLKADGTNILGSPLQFTATTLDCPATFSYQGQEYEAVRIGDQCWMAENMNYAYGNSWCYDNDPDNCNIYGRLYDWETALGVCPDGWKLPGDEEWKQLEGAADSQYGYPDPEWDAIGQRGFDVTKNLKATSGWDDWENNGNGTDLYGFGALPGGQYWSSAGYFMWEGEWGYWWSSSSVYNQPWNRHLENEYDGAFRNTEIAHYWGLSVRCIKEY